MDDEPKQPQPEEVIGDTGGGGGWGGWGMPSFSFVSDLQKAATVAAEEISRNAVAVAKNAAKTIGEIQNIAPEAEMSNGDEESEQLAPVEEVENSESILRKSALEKLEKASDDTMLSQSLKVFDNSVENFASGAWQAFGSAIKGGSEFVQKLENSAANLAKSIQHGGQPAAAGSDVPSLLETGKSFTTMGIQVLERVGKETMELLIKETGFDVENNLKISDHADDDQLYEEVTFDRCFYIYGGPEQLEELEALSNHYALLFNRRKAKLSSEQKTYYDGKLKQVQQYFNLSSEINGKDDSNKGKEIESVVDESGDEIKVLRDSSVTKAAKMASGFTTILAELAATEVIYRTADRLETIHSEGVHRLSELCCLAVSQLLLLGKSIISNATKEQTDNEVVKIDWPEESAAKAKIIRSKAQSMAGDIEAVSRSFITGISDIVGAYEAAIKVKDTEVPDALSQKSIQEKANAISKHLNADHTTAMDKIRDGLQSLSFVIMSTTMPSP